MNDIDFMRAALLQAKHAFEKGEVPVGAVIAYNGVSIAEAHNEVEASREASAHAELLAMRRAAGVLGNWRLTDCVLYTTLEPCIMCSGAAILSRVKKIVYSARDLRHGGDGSITSLFDIEHPIHRVEIEGGLCAEESATLMQTFFKERRHATRSH